jgi:quinol monooxygenase YgiN
MIIAIGDVYIQIPQRVAAEEAMLQAQTHAQDEPGCVSYAFAEVLESPGHFMVVQRWSDQQALDAHYSSPGFAEYQQRIAPMLLRESEMQMHVVDAQFRPLDSSSLSIGHDD